MRLTTLLVPHDGSWMADRALACATMLRGATGARVDLLRLAPDLAPGTLAVSAQTAGSTGAWDGAPSGDRGMDLGDPVACVLDAIQCQRPDLVVLASDGWSSLGLGGDLACRVASRSPVPVLVIPTSPASSQNRHDLRRVLVALDGSEQAEQALTPALVLADALGADMLLLRVVTPRVAVFGGRARNNEVDLAAARRYVEDLAGALPSTRTKVSALAVVGEPGTMIPAVSRTQRASVIAMTTRGGGALTSPELGGVAAAALQSAVLPLLLVPPLAANTPEVGRRRSRRPESMREAVDTANVGDCSCSPLQSR